MAGQRTLQPFRPQHLMAANPLESPSASTRHAASAADWNWKARFEAYNRLQAVAVDFGENLPIPEIVAVGGQSDGKSTLLEALLGFRFNVRAVEMGTRRPLIVQMVHDPTAHHLRCRFKEEDSEEYASPVVVATEIADVIKQRTQSHLEKVQAAVSSQPIVMRAEYAHCPNLTIIDTPGFVLNVGIHFEELLVSLNIIVERATSRHSQIILTTGFSH